MQGAGRAPIANKVAQPWRKGHRTLRSIKRTESSRVAETSCMVLPEAFYDASLSTQLARRPILMTLQVRNCLGTKKSEWVFLACRLCHSMEKMFIPTTYFYERFFHILSKFRLLDMLIESDLRKIILNNNKKKNYFDF